MDLATEQTTSARGRLHLACLALGERVYGIDVLQVREVVRARPVTPLPSAPPLVEGVVELRGATLPVVDLARVLHAGAAAARPSQRLVVVEVDGLRLGLHVEAALEVLSVDAAVLELPPPIESGPGSLLRGVVRRESAPPLPVLSLEQLLESVKRSRPEEAKG